MKIAFLIPTVSNFGGIERITTLLVNYLCLEKDYEITLISYYFNGEEVYSIDSKIKRKHIYNERISIKKGIFKAVHFLRADIDVEEYDILIACGSIYFPVGVLATLGKKTKLILWEHTHYYGNGEIKLQRYSRKGWIEFADAIVTLTESDKNIYLENSFTKKIHCIPNPIDPLIEKINKKHIKPQNKIVSVGRLTDIKNFADCIKVAATIFDEYRDWIWEIYGDGELRDELQSLIEKNKLTNKVILKGNVKNLYSRYPEYKIFVSTSKSEGFGLAILEAMAMGVPVIAYDVQHGPKELIDDNENGYLIPFGNTTLMIKRMQTLFEDEKLRRNLAANSKKISESFGMKIIIQKWVDLLEKVRR